MYVPNSSLVVMALKEKHRKIYVEHLKDVWFSKLGSNLLGLSVPVWNLADHQKENVPFVMPYCIFTFKFR